MYKKYTRIVISSLFAISCSSEPLNQTTTSAVQPKLITIAAVADIGCSSSQRKNGKCEDISVSKLVRGLSPDRILAIGDIQYHSHDISEFKENFGKYWADLISITKPALGNHEYEQLNAAGFFKIWKDVPKTGYYSFDLNETWKIFIINTNDECVFVKCSKSSKQYAWLKNGLESTKKCTIVAGHHPRFSSGPHGESLMLYDIYELMKQYKVSIYLSGHDHHYERFSSKPEQFVVGTGGKSLRSVGSPMRNSVFINDEKSGVLFMTINKNTIKTKFVTIDNKEIDHHKITCNR